jgi:glycine dehydrogenase subunit 2
LRTIFEASQPGRRAVWFEPAAEAAPPDAIPAERRREVAPGLPEVAEIDLMRHYVGLSHLNYSIASGPYPLGSCTMKYNPVVNERIAALPGLSGLHPRQPLATVQGALALMVELEAALCELTGMDAYTLQPAAGAQGELTGMLIVRAYHSARGQDGQRTEVLVPDSAHGTNPATASMAGFSVVAVPSDRRGNVDIAALRARAGAHTAGLMLTNPSTLGVFDDGIEQIAGIVHDAGGLLYYDGANMNPILGITRPGDMGFDVMHLNLHKTFSTPHGGGGPGAGPVGVKAFLRPFLPGPRPVRLEAAGDGLAYGLEAPSPESIGRVRSFFGNFLVLVRAYAYILAQGGEGLRQVAEDAVLAANYLARSLGPDYPLAYDRTPMHEFVVSAGALKQATGIRALDLAKGLCDQEVHPPTVYFPLTVDEAMMVEPTETEAKENLDRVAAAFRRVAELARSDPARLRTAPHTAPVSRLDEARATRRPDLRYRRGESLPERDPEHAQAGAPAPALRP